MVAETLIKKQTFRDLAPVHAEMIACYRGRDFDGAARLAERCHALGAGFGLAGRYDLYRDRIAAFLAAPPPADWTGVFSATSK